MASFDKSALLVVDMQNDFMHPDGACCRMGFPDPGTPVVPQIQQLLDAARTQKSPVVWISANYSPDIVGPAFKAKMADFPIPVCVSEWGMQTTDQLKAEEGEIQVQKTCYNAFHQTDLAATLRALGVDTVVVTGILTAVCVESTARASVFEGFHTVVAEDAVGDAEENNAAFFKRFSTFFGKVEKTEVICGHYFT
jgi:ureidoacrylate peracid hydrolase